MIAGGVFLAQHRDVMVRAVHRRAHQVAGAGVHADVLLVGVLLVAGGRHQRAVGAEHEAAQLRADAHVAHAGGHEHLFIGLAHALADGRDVVLRILRAVCDAHAAGEVDQRDVRAGLAVQLHRRLKQDARQHRVVRVGQRVGREERVQAEVPGALLHQRAVRLRELRAGHAVFGVLGLIHDPVADGKLSARIEAAGHQLRHAAAALLQRLNQRIIVQIDDAAQAVRQRELACLRLVGGEHDLLAAKAAGAAEHQLGIRGAVHAAALLAQDAEDERIGRRLHGKVLPEALVPRERAVQRAGRAADARLVIDMKRRRIRGDNLLRLLKRDKRFLLAHLYASFPRRAGRDMKNYIPHYTDASFPCQDKRKGK